MVTNLIWTVAVGALFSGSMERGTETNGSTPKAHAFAIVVGTNLGGDGQAPLRFAENDAVQMAKVLVELSDYAEENVQVVIRPNREQLFAELRVVADQIEALRAVGEQTTLFFYYSGHARASSLSLGTEEVPLTDLRERILAVPATLAVVVLDACQSGAFSGIKGATPAADFSANSVTGLDTEGVAVIASSSATELSQESEELQASYFSHHFVVGMRGAADDDQDGRVSLDEAYRYAYHRTLVDTAATATGAQHITLETDLKGKGDVVLSVPARASAQLTLADDLAGRILIHQTRTRSVVAEVLKARGDRVRLALAPNDYGAVVRFNDKTYRCTFSTTEGRDADLSLEDCTQIRTPAPTVKGNASEEPKWGVELEVGVATLGRDRYNARLDTFGYSSTNWLGWPQPVFYLTMTRELWQNLSLALVGGYLEDEEYRRKVKNAVNESAVQSFSWRTYGLALHARYTKPLKTPVIFWFAQAGVGAALAHSSFVDRSQASTVRDDQDDFGIQVAAALGMQAMLRHVGLTMQIGYVYAPALENLLGDRHNSGGLEARLGIRTAF